MSVQNPEVGNVGQPLPDFALPSHTGQLIRTTDYRGRKNLVIQFMREFNCPQCIDYARQLALFYPEIQKTNTEIIVLGLGGEALAQRLAKRINAPFPVLYDREGTVYDQFRLERVLFSLIQQSAAFVVDQSGVIRYSHRVVIPHQWLRLGALAELLASLNVPIQELPPKPQPVRFRLLRRWMPLLFP